MHGYCSATTRPIYLVSLAHVRCVRSPPGVLRFVLPKNFLSGSVGSQFKQTYPTYHTQKYSKSMNLTSLLHYDNPSKSFFHLLTFQLELSPTQMSSNDSKEQIITQQKKRSISLQNLCRIPLVSSEKVSRMPYKHGISLISTQNRNLGLTPSSDMRIERFESLTSFFNDSKAFVSSEAEFLNVRFLAVFSTHLSPKS